MKSEIVLELKDLTKTYPPSVQAVAGVSLKIRRGEIYALLGLNGAGKTTLFAMILGLLRPTRGSILFCGADLLKNPQSRVRLGGFIEEPPFYPHLSAATQLKIAGRLRGRRLEPSRCREVLEFVGLAEVGTQPVGQFSTGMKRRLGIARAIAFTPELIMLDEPSSGLDPQGLVEIRRLLQRLRDELKQTVLIATHLLSEAEQLASRVGILKEGHLVCEGRVKDWLTATQRYLLHVREGAQAQELIENLAGVQLERREGDRLLVQLSGMLPEELNALLVREGIRVRELTRVHHTLEDIFLAIVKGDHAD